MGDGWTSRLDWLLAGDADAAEEILMSLGSMNDAELLEWKRGHEEETGQSAYDFLDGLVLRDG